MVGTPILVLPFPLPYDPRAWEATVPFLRKWGWVVRECRELLVSTNYWREKRGEKRLVFDMS